MMVVYQQCWKCTVVGLLKSSPSVSSVKGVYYCNSITCDSGVLSVEEVIQTCPLLHTRVNYAVPCYNGYVCWHTKYILLDITVLGTAKVYEVQKWCTSTIVSVLEVYTFVLCHQNSPIHSKQCISAKNYLSHLYFHIGIHHNRS